MSRVGFIGLGTMGRPMAKNLLSAGHELVFLARRPEVSDEFLALGAHQAATPAEVTQKSDVVITIVTADEEVRQVALGPEGIVHAAAPGKVLIEMSTIGADTTRDVATRLGEAGMAMLDAPVSGGPWGAEAGTLTIMAGGEKEVLERCRSLLEAMGEKIFHVGPIGSGQTVKLVNQMIGGGIMTLIAEGFVLAKAANVDLDKLVDVVSVSSGNSTLFEARARKFVLANNYEPGFKTELMHKDVALAIEMGRKLGVSLPVSSAALEQYTAAITAGDAENDFAAVAHVTERASGRKIVE